MVSLIWVIPWLIVAKSRLVERRVEKSADAPATKAILRERSLWGASLGNFCTNYAWYFVLSWIPYYLVHERGWSLAQMATIGGAAYLLMALSGLWTGWTMDRWVRSGSSVTLVRKTFLGVGYLLVAVFVMGCAIADARTSIILLLLACASFGMGAPNLLAVGQTLAGAEAAGRWIGVQNCVGNIAGLIAPWLTGVLVDRTGHFKVAFVLAAVVSALGAVAWVFGVGPVKQIDWARRGRSTITPPSVAPSQ